MAPLIDVRDVSFGYTGQPVVRDVSLAVAPGEYVGIVGPNGSGKSTLLKLMLGLLAPDSGDVRLLGAPARDFEHRERVGYVAQDATEDTKQMPITVEEVVLMGRFPHAGFGRVGAADREKAREALRTVGIASLADRQVTALSGGQRQRAFIARALAAEADLLVLDEPTVGIDAESVAAFFDLLASLNDDGLTVVLVEHDVGAVLDHASRVVCLNREVVFDGTPESFVETDALDRAYGTATRLDAAGETTADGAGGASR